MVLLIDPSLSSELWKVWGGLAFLPVICYLSFELKLTKTTDFIPDRKSLMCVNVLLLTQINNI